MLATLVCKVTHAHPEVIKGASAVIEMEGIKHPFAKAVQARKGIEF